MLENCMAANKTLLIETGDISNYFKPDQMGVAAKEI
jgi:hypothetical protein